MIDNNHEAFSPPLENLALWRYTDLSKLLSLLEHESLHFTRADQFEDPYEGRISDAMVRLLREHEGQESFPVGMANRVLDGIELFRSQIFVNCWCALQHESAAMWKLYLDGPHGVAIKSDHDALVKVLEPTPLRIRTSLINYVDYQTTPISTRNMFFPFLCKRLSFAHESELRVVIWSLEDVNQSQIAREALQLEVRINIRELIQAIHVSPWAPEWYGELVERLIRRYGLSCPVVRSPLYSRPAY